MTESDKRKANAERQKAYRARHREKSGQRLDMQVSIDTAGSLRILALHGNKTKKEVVEQLIAEAMHKLNNDPSVDMPALFAKL